MRGNNLDKARRLTDLLLSSGCRKTIILKDLHRSTQAQIEERFNQVGFGSDAKLCIIVNAIEAWLVADEKAIGDYLSSEVKAVHNPEEIPRPDEFLNNIFKKIRGRPYLKGGKDPAEIAKRLRLNIVEQKCPSFREFRAAVHT